MTIKRREFLAGSALAAGAFALGFAMPGKVRANVAGPEAETFVPNAFIRIDRDNSVTIIMAKSEMGQSVYTNLPLIVAEELDVDWQNIQVEQSGVDAAYNQPGFPVMITGGSSSVNSNYEALRTAGATARAMLVGAAAESWGVPAGSLTTGEGRVTGPGGSRSASYGELAELASRQPVPETVTLKQASEFRLLGKEHKRLDSGIKVTGEARYGLDVSVPGMRYAAVARAPVFGATLVSHDAGKALAMPGVIKVKQVPSGVAVIADSSWRAMKARDALETTWDGGENASRNTPEMLEQYRALANQSGYVVLQKGDFEGVAANAAKTIEARYEFPFLAHACMEPLNCTVHDQGGKAEIWTGSQNQTIDRAQAAAILGCEPEAVDFHTMFLGGGFGRRAGAYSDFVAEAAHVAKGEGFPVKVTWTREDDMRGGQYRPMTIHQSTLALDTNGLPLAWRNRVVSQKLNGLEMFGMKAENFDGPQVEGLEEMAYPVANVTLEAHLVESPIICLWWRSVGHTHTAFLKETLMDEAAHAAGIDPMDYRLRLLEGHPRYVDLLNKVKDMSGWGRKLPTGAGLGVAIAESFGTIVAEVAQVKVEDTDIRVEKVWCAVDCGFAVNPLGVREQMESGIVYGLSAALYGEITFDEGKVVQGNFNSYRVMRMNDSPGIEVEVINSGAKMGGVGEPGTPPVFPAVGNAIFAASGRRLRSLPFRI